MKKLIMIALASTAMLAAPAMATPGNNGGGNGGCGNGQQTNGCGGDVGPVSGGAGGTGGAGGVGTGIGVGIAGAAANASATGGASTALGGLASASTGAIRNDNSNANLNSSAASNRNDIDNRNTISTLVGTSSSNTVGDTSASTANANNSSVVVEGDEAQRRNPVSTAYAAPLVASADTCMGSSTAGAQGIGFGISIGSTWTDKNCVRLKNSRELVAMGYAPAAVQLLCTDKEVRAAMRAAGTPCK